MVPRKKRRDQRPKAPRVSNDFVAQKKDAMNASAAEKGMARTRRCFTSFIWRKSQRRIQTIA